jgi:TolA-binding protein
VLLAIALSMGAAAIAAQWWASRSEDDGRPDVAAPSTASSEAKEEPGSRLADPPPEESPAPTAGPARPVDAGPRAAVARVERVARTAAAAAEVAVAAKLSQAPERSTEPTDPRASPSSHPDGGPPSRADPAPDAGDASKVARAAAEPPSPSFDAAVARDEQRLGTSTVRDIEASYADGLDRVHSVEGRLELRDLIDRYPGSNRAACAAMNLASVYLAEEDLDEALPLLERLVSPGTDAVFRNGSPVLPQALLAYASVEEARGDLDAARAAWQRVISEFPDARDQRGVSFAAIARQHLR